MDYKSAWLIIAKANLHVGNENVANYGLIDKAVQRDAITNLPCINSSSLKGALNEYATVCLSKSLTADQRVSIFGVDKGDKNKSTQKGNTSFFDAEILALPRPSETNLYELASCDAVLERFCSRLNTFGLNLTVEELKDIMAQHCGRNVSVYVAEDFHRFCDDLELPIIARNCLENGESRNLWYEQVLPRETVFGTLMLAKNDDLAKVLDGKIVQIGANATIGYGFCKLVKIANNEEE